MRLERFAALLSSISLLFACSMTGAEAGEAFIIRGDIDAAQLQRLRSANWVKFKSVEVSSAQGDSIVALEAAAILRSAGKPIVIKGVCGSACLWMVAASSQPTRFSPNAKILLDESATSTVLIFGQRYPNAMKKAYGEREKSENLLVSSAKLDRRLLIIPQIVMNTKCFSGPSVDAEDFVDDMQYGAVFTAWMPRDEILSGLGFKVSRDANVGDIPPEYLSAINGYKRLSSRVTSFNLDISTLPSYEIAASNISRLPTCGKS